jgi:amidase
MVAKKMNLDNNTAGMLLSAIGELEICQVVDPLVTVRFGIAKEYAI